MLTNVKRFTPLTYEARYKVTTRRREKEGIEHGRGPGVKEG